MSSAISCASRVRSTAGVGRSDHGLQRAPDELFELTCSQVGVIELGTERVDQLGVDHPAYIRERIGGGGLRLVATAHGAA